MDEIVFTKNLKSYLEEVKPSTIYLFSGVDSDSKLKVDEPSDEYTNGFKVDRELLWGVISNLRAIKTAEEIEILRYVCRVTS